MKRIILPLLFLAIGLSSFAGEINKAILQSFHQQFGQPSEVVADEVDGMARISFKQNNERFAAYYSQEGELIVISKEINSDQLPLMMKQKLEKHLKDATVSECYQMESKGSISYVVVLQSARKTTTYRNDGTGWYQVTSKRKKQG
jgi:hypothetical protein